MATQPTIRTLALGLVLLTGTAHAGWFSKKKAPPPPPPPAPVVVVPVEPPPPPPPIPLEFSGIQTQAPAPAPLDRVKYASPEVQSVAQWVAESKDNAKLPFIVVDKANAQVYAFTPYGQLQATAPVLLGMGVGDVALVSQDAPMSAMTPDKRITPAGRYVSRLVMDPHTKHPVLLIDGQNLITLHIVAKGTPAQRRAERLASASKDDNRISFGCINVPPAFFETIVDPAFRPAKGIVYILPEKTTAAQLFGFQPPANGPIALQTALSSTEAQAGAQSATAIQASFQAPQSSAPPQTSLQLSPSPAPVQTALQTAPSPDPLQASVPAAPSPAPVQTALQQTAPSPDPLQASLPAAPSPAPMQTALQTTQPPAPIEAPQTAPVNLGDTAAKSAPDTQ